jgi:hypothetical protein
MTDRDTIALESATKIMAMSGHSRSQLKARIQVEILNAIARANAAEMKPVAWLHEITETNEIALKILSGSEENPWSHWMAEHLERCVYTKTPLGIIK